MSRVALDAPVPSAQRPHARRRARAATAPPPATPNALTPTPWNLACSSIAGRRASGFLQVSLSKVSRHETSRCSSSFSRRDTSDNANDYPGPIGPPIRRRALSTSLKARPSCLTALTIGTVPI